MNKTRFQLPQRTASTDDFERWVAGGAAAAASRRADEKAAVAPGVATDPLASMRLPFLFDIGALLAAQQRNLEAITAASLVVREGVQAVARHNFEIVQQAFDGISQRMQAMDIPECPADRAMRQTETAIKAYEDAATNVRAVGELIQHTNLEAMEVLGKRFAEVADEMKSLSRYATRRFWETEAKPAPFWQQT